MSFDFSQTWTFQVEFECSRCNWKHNEGFTNCCWFRTNMKTRAPPPLCLGLGFLPLGMWSSRLSVSEVTQVVTQQSHWRVVKHLLTHGSRFWEKHKEWLEKMNQTANEEGWRQEGRTPQWILLFQKCRYLVLCCIFLRPNKWDPVTETMWLRRESNRTFILSVKYQTPIPNKNVIQSVFGVVPCFGGF